MSSKNKDTKDKFLQLLNDRGRGMFKDSEVRFTIIKFEGEEIAIIYAANSQDVIDKYLNAGRDEGQEDG